MSQLVELTGIIVQTCVCVCLTVWGGDIFLFWLIIMFSNLVVGFTFSYLISAWYWYIGGKLW